VVITNNFRCAVEATALEMQCIGTSGKDIGILNK